MPGARIKGVIELNEYEVRGVERHKIIQKIFLEMAKVVQEKRNLQEGNTLKSREESKVNQGAASFMGTSSLGQFSADTASSMGSKKRFPKFKSSLVAPSLKVRKVGGAKFKPINEEENFDD